jgi:ribosomal protein S27E
MSQPLNGNLRIESYHGQFALRVICKACGHESAILSRDLAKRARGNERIVHLAKRFRCRKCGSRENEIWVVGVGRG